MPTPAYISPDPYLQFLDANGNPYVAGKLYTYAAGTTTPLATYTDSTGGSANTNPVILGTAGEASVWLLGSSYKFVLKDSTDALVKTIDNILPSDNGTAAVAALTASLAASGGSVLVGFLQSGPGMVATDLQEKGRRTVNIFDAFTASQRTDVLTRAQTLDITAAAQAVYTYAGTIGGCEVIWPRGSYKVTGPIFVPSNTHTKFERGAYLCPVAIASFTELTFPAHGAWGYGCLVNENWTAGSLTDENIVYDGVGFLPGAAWNGHVIVSRMITNPQIRNGYGINAADYCSVMACQDIIVEKNWTSGMTNCAFDFWEGNVNADIIGNVARSCNAGVNWNATDTYHTSNLVASGARIGYNKFYGGPAAGIFVSPLNAGSTCVDVKIFKNYIDQNLSGVANSIGVAVQRSSDVTIEDNTFNRIGVFSPIVVTADAFSGVSTKCSITNNRITNSTCTGVPYIQAFGTNHIISGNEATNSTCDYAVQVDDPTTIVMPQNLGGYGIGYILNQHAGGGATTPAFEQDVDQANGWFYFRQPIRTDQRIHQQTVYGVTAVGTNLATALPITVPYTYVSSAAAGTGVALPAATYAAAQGAEFVIWNQGGSAITVYANTGDTIAGGASVSIASGARARFVCLTASFWLVSGT